ncbi:MAG: hypothetical protein JNM07_10365 [Phycisphaerae bacterium]|nr:hypothetical protein [Phycisphaerae bacterium]
MRTCGRVMMCLAASMGAALSVAGCSVGYDRLLFVTKSNAGLDVDTMPPTAQVSVGRMEGVFAPTYETGDTPPVVGSFRYRNSDFFSPYIGSTFCVGDAALAMTRLYSLSDSALKAAAADAGAIDGKKRTAFESNFDSTIELPHHPSFPSFTPAHDREENTRPVIFGTDTSLGLKVAWSGLTAGAPDALRFGFSRKELAWAPLTYMEKNPTGEHSGGNGPVTVRPPSLLATLETGAGASTSFNRAKFEYVQYFATGKAATALATQQDVRAAIIKRLDPNAELIIANVGKFSDSKTGERLDRWLDADPNNRAKLKTWLATNGINVTPTSFIGDSKFEPQHERAIKDLSVPD